MKKERIDKILSSQSMMTRSEAASLIRSGSVSLNGATVKSPSEKADPKSEVITVTGKPFIYRRHVYIMLNKPAGVVSASSDPREKTVVDLVPRELLRPGLFPAGRLDKDTVGFVIITDDGDFAHNILSPKRHVEKVYIAETENYIGDEYLAAMREGMTIYGEDRLLPAKIRLVEDSETKSYEIAICEGKYHQIKKMIAAAEAKLLSLKRIKIGGLFLDESLKPSQCRLISDGELSLITEREK